MHYLDLNAVQTNDLIIDFGKNHRNRKHNFICREEVKNSGYYKYLGTVTDTVEI